MDQYSTTRATASKAGHHFISPAVSGELERVPISKKLGLLHDTPHYEIVDRN